MTRRSVEVTGALAGERLDRLIALVAEVSRSRAADLVDSGEIAVDGVVERGRARRVAAGETVTLPAVEPAGPRPPLAPDPGVAFSVVHADEEVVVVDKPAGLMVHPGAGRGGTTLANGLLARFPEIAAVGEPDRPGIVHRLDQHTSGLLVVARTRGAYENLVRQLADRTAGREYLALVWGHPAADRGLIDAPLGRSGRDRTRMAVVTGGREARTRYAVRSRFTVPTETALLTCALETGRTHQIRVHLSSIGHPVVGDDRYGDQRPGLPVGRPFLHAARLSFAHPGSGRPVTFEAPLPDELSGVLELLA